MSKYAKTMVNWLLMSVFFFTLSACGKNEQQGVSEVSTEDLQKI